MDRVKQYFVLILVTAMACTASEPLPLPAVADYFPLKKGIFQIYSVDSVVTTQNVQTAFSYRLKVEVVDSFPNTAGGYSYLLSRSIQANDQAPWKSTGSWSARADKFQAVVNEGNVSYLNIAGPLDDGKAWNGNAYNSMGGNEKCLDSDAYTCDIYTIDQFKKPYESTGGKFDNTLTVIENDNKDLIVSQDKRWEVYAVHVGLIEQNIIQLEYCTDPDCVGTQFVTKGLMYKLVIAEYGGI